MTSPYKIKNEYPYYDMYCHFCHIMLTDEDIDDIGIWYLHPIRNEPGGNACRNCENGTPGNLHRSIYGVGER